MIDVEALIVGPVVTVPMVMLTWGMLFDMAGRLAFGFGLARGCAGQEAAQECVPGWRAADSSRARRGIGELPAESDREPEPVGNKT